MIKKRLNALRSREGDIKRGTKVMRDVIDNLDDYSYVRALSRDTGTVDGFEPHVGILDEYAASKTTEMMELLESGQALLDNSLILIISTAGFDLNAPMHTIEYPYATKILSGEVVDDTYFAYIAEQDDAAEVDDKSMWIKSNPILAIPELQDQVYGYLDKRWTEAKEKGTRNAVLVKITICGVRRKKIHIWILTPGTPHAWIQLTLTANVLGLALMWVNHPTCMPLAG